eukprot:COSAG04_NODE_1248_length_7581_cov_24.589453_2_plen_108_part_00
MEPEPERRVVRAPVPRSANADKISHPQSALRRPVLVVVWCRYDGRAGRDATKFTFFSFVRARRVCATAGGLVAPAGVAPVVFPSGRAAQQSWAAARVQGNSRLVRKC